MAYKLKGNYRSQGENSWEIRIGLGKNQRTGKYETHRETFRGSEGECQKRIDQLIYEFKHGKKPNPNKMTIAQLFEHWMKDYVEAQLKSSTIRTYRSTVKNHIIPHTGKYLLEDFSPYHLDQLYNKLRADGVSNSIITDIHSCFCSAMERAYMWDFLDDKFKIDKIEPVPKKERIKMKAQKKEKVVWNGEQTLYFLNYAENNCERRYFIYLIAFTTGIRRGENLGLKWEKINFDTRTLHIAGSYTDSTFEDYTKTEKSVRKVYMIPFLAEKLKKYKDIQDELRKLYKKAYCNENWVHCNALGEILMCSTSVTKNFNYDLFDCNQERKEKDLEPLPVITFHDLRHTCATLLKEVFKIPSESIAEILGHADYRTTRKYEHPSVEIQKGPLNNIDTLLRQEFGSPESSPESPKIFVGEDKNRKKTGT